LNVLEGFNMLSKPQQPEYFSDEKTVVATGEKVDAVYLGTYRLIERLGAGGMGEVYLAEDPQLNRRIALKMLPAQLTQEPESLRRFVQEAKAASALNHPNIITIYEIGQDKGNHYIAMEHVEGQTLRGRLAPGLTILEILDIAIQTASALSAAHKVGIIHRDIKPENVMVRPDGLVKILDFGVAKLVEKPHEIPGESENQRPPVPAPVEETLPGILVGTVSYMSPEQLRGLQIDTRSDIFSFGVVLYEVIAGKPPFTGQTQVGKMVSILERTPDPLADHRPETPQELERIVSKALQKDRNARYQQIEDMLNDLKELKQELEFQQKLERSGKSEMRPYFTARSEARPTSDQNSAQTTSSTRIILSELTRHKRASLLVVLILIAATIGLGYLGYRIFEGSDSRITSVAVLPFKNTSNDPEKDYLADGISESLINQLSQLPGLKVIANSSSSRFKGMEADPQEVARALDTSGILTGRVSQRGDQLTVSVELIDARDRTQVWGEQYNRKATDALALQAQISREIAEKLRVRLTAGQQDQLAKRVGVNPEAYVLLLRGYSHRAKGSTEDRKKAAEYFNQAVLTDPQYALAHAELSDIYRSLVGSSLLDPIEYTAKAREAAQRAIELDDGLGEAHCAMANMKTLAWEWEGAEAEYKRAIELKPNLALAHRWYATYLTLTSQHDQAIAEIKRARELDPISPGLNATVGYVLYLARRYDEASESLNATRGTNRDYPYTHLFLGFTYAAKGLYDQAIKAYQEAIRLGLDTPSTQVFLGSAHALAGQREQALAILKKLQTASSYPSPGHLAILYAALGDRERAFSSLEKAYQAHDPQLQYLGVSPGYDSLRSDPRFHELLLKVGLNH
jgi:serine/threonine-protein kinase